MRARLPWQQIKLEFLSGLTAVELAEKYNCKANTITIHAMRGGWQKDRKEINRAVDIKQKELIQASLAERQIAFLAKKEKIADELLTHSIYLAETARAEHNSSLFEAARKGIDTALNHMGRVLHIPDRVIETHTFDETKRFHIEKEIKKLTARYVDEAQDADVIEET